MKNKKVDMVGAIQADTIMHSKPQGRGYVRMEKTVDFPWPDTLPQSAVIKVIGVGGGGGNAVNQMVEAAIEDGLDRAVARITEVERTPAGGLQARGGVALGQAQQALRTA